MAHPQYNFTSNFNGSEGNNAELTLNINGVEKKYTPAGNDKTYNVPGVACIPTNLSSADLVNAIATAISGAALPVLVDLGADVDAAFYKYSGRSNDTWTFTLITTQRVYTIDVDVQTGTITRSDISLDKSVVHVSVDHANLHAYITGLLGADRTPVLVMSDTDPDTPGVTRDFYFYPTARTGVDSDYSFIGYDGEVVKVATVHDDGTVTYATYGELIVDETPTKNSKNPVASGGVYEDVKDFRNFFVAKYDETTYAEVREAAIQNKKIICIKDHTVYTYAFISNNRYEFAGSVDSDGDFKVVKVSSPDVWTTESHNVKEFSVYRNSFNNLHPASAVLTDTDISRGYIDIDLDLGFPSGWIVSWCGEPTIIIGLPGIPWQASAKSMLKEVFTKVVLYTKTTDAQNIVATEFDNLNSTDDGRAVTDGNVTWNRTFTGIGISLLELQGFTARCFLNTNSSVVWTAGLKVELYIHFTVIL